jgi:hypothetical protein
MTAPTQFVEANRIRFAYRRCGQETGVPLLFMQHFRGGLDHWDPSITDGFGKDRPVIGGYVAQAFTLRHPNLVRRLMLVGTGLRGGEPPTDPQARSYGDGKLPIPVRSS